jgi:hypothetical protein
MAPPADSSDPASDARPPDPRPPEARPPDPRRDHPPRRIDRVLDPSYLEGLGARPLDELRAMRDECNELETELSYVRRLAQGRIDILGAETERRAAGGSLAGSANDQELVAALTDILADHGPRADPADSRLSARLAPSMEIQWKRGLERLLSDATLVDLANLGDDELAESREQLGELETVVSATRRALHAVTDAIERELAARLAVGQS